MNEQLRDLLATVLELETEDIHEDLRSADVETWDSFTHVMIMSNLEERFAIQLSPAEATAIRSVGDIQETLQKRGIEA